MHPVFLGDRSGSARQRTLTDWSSFGTGEGANAADNSSAASTPITLTAATSAATFQRCVVPDEDPNRALDIDEEDELLGQGEGQEDDGGNDDDEMCEDDDGDSSANTHSRRYLPPIVNESYQHHIDYIKKTKGVDLKPRIYAVNGTFWLPRKSNFFILHGHSKPRPSQLYMPRFFLWDPEHLIQGSLQCPKCRSPLE